MREKLSAFVVTYNRASMLETCLRAVSFVDELIVVDKSSTDGSAAVAKRYADRVEVVPWTPTVEETLAFALSLCRHDRILFLCDDEILTPETGPYLLNQVVWSDADIHSIPYRHYILGVHDERAYYWPEVHHRLFRRGALEFIPTVHGGIAFQSDRISSIPVDSGACIHHLSYQDVASWIERTNRYTGRPDRIHVEGGKGNLIRFAHEQIDHWMQRTDDASGNDYPAAVALLRAIYDMVDRLKDWEVERGLDGAALFRIAQNNLVSAIEGRERRGAMKELGRQEHWEPRDVSVHESEAMLTPLPNAAAGPRNSQKDERHMEMQAMLVRLRATEAQLRERIGAERKCALSLERYRNEIDETSAALAGTRNDLEESRATVEHTQATLEHTRATLDETRATLGQTRAELDQTQARLNKVNLESEHLSNSARLFIRQYLPKLWRHILPWRS